MSFREAMPPEPPTRGSVSGGALNSTQTKPNFGVPFPLRDPGSCQCFVAFLSSSLCIATACDCWSKINEMKMKYTVYWNHTSLPAKRHLDQSTRFYLAFYLATLCLRGIWQVLCLSERLSVCSSITSQYCIKTIGRIELVLAWRLPSPYPTLYCKEI